MLFEPPPLLYLVSTLPANARSPPAPGLSRADVTQPPPTGSHAGVPNRRHPACEKRGMAGQSAGRDEVFAPSPLPPEPHDLAHHVNPN